MPGTKTNHIIRTSLPIYNRTLDTMNPTSPWRQALILTLVMATPAFAAPNAPDAGQTLQQMAPRLQAPAPSKGINFPASPVARLSQKGTRIPLRTVHFTGNTRFTDAALLGALGNLKAHTYNFAGLKGLADRISRYYRAQGYPFARAFLPAQKLGSDTLTIAVVEGRYGTVTTAGNKKLTRQAGRFLSRLKPHDLIKSTSLERAILILQDQPGINIAPIIRPGKTEGTGDLVVPVNYGRRWAGALGLDNQGSRYTGRERAHLNLNINSPFLLGDQITLTSLVSTHSLWLGSLSYQLPLGGSGLRGKIGYNQTNYKLGKEFAALDATGYAKVSTLGVSYPMIRSRQTNLSLAITYQHKALEDKQNATHTQNRKTSNSLPVSLNFNQRDELGGGGLTYGTLSWTLGKLTLDSGPNQLVDQTTAKTAGHYSKINLDIARIQTLPAHVSLYGHIAGQWANKNLDSSESFGLGGANGVRAYPSGEGYGDEGWLTQLELRYTGLLMQAARVTPYVFYDSGRVKINRTPWSATTNYRRISGAGMGTRAQYQQFSADVSLAWRTQGGNPTSSTRHSQPVIWASLGYGF